MDQDHHGKILRRHAPGKDEVGGNDEPVARGVPDRLFGCEVRGGEIGSRIVEKLGLPGGAVEQVAGARIHVARHTDEGDVLVERRRPERILPGGKDLLHLLPLARELFLFRIEAHPVADIDRRQELVCDVGEDGRREIHFVLRILLHKRRRSGLHVEQLNLRPVGRRPPVCGKIEFVPVRGEPDKGALFLFVDGINPGERFPVDAEDLRSAVRRLPHAEPEVSAEVGQPSDDVPVVLPEERLCARGDVEAVHVVEIGAPVVHADDDLAGRRSGEIDDFDTDFSPGSQIPRTRRRIGGRVRIHRIQPVVLVSPFVLDIQDKFAVQRPEIRTHRPCRVGGDRPRTVERFRAGLHPDVAHPVQRFQERDVSAVGRDLGSRYLRVTEEKLPVDKRRELAETGDGESQDEEKGDERTAYHRDDCPFCILCGEEGMFPGCQGGPDPVVQPAEVGEPER